MAGLEPGQMIDEYRIISKIGKGGMATVYKAHQSSVDRNVAIKILSFHLVDNEEFQGRFKQEARLIARLEHPNILPVYDYGEHQGIPFLVMRFLDAGTLKDRMRQFGVSALQTLPLEEIDSIFSQIADALGYAHENGVIHRDIKPSNIMLDRHGRVFLTDFGIAKLIETTHGGSNIYSRETIQLFTATGAVTGTPDYMSPEQAQGLRLDQRSDIYSLGIVLYEMLTGKVPFDAETPMAVIMKQITEPLPQPSLLRPDLHPALETVVQKALEKSPAARYTTMYEFLTAWKQAYAEALRQAPGVQITPGVQSTPGVQTTPYDHRGLDLRKEHDLVGAPPANSLSKEQEPIREDLIQTPKPVEAGMESPNVKVVSDQAEGQPPGVKNTPGLASNAKPILEDQSPGVQNTPGAQITPGIRNTPIGPVAGGMHALEHEPWMEQDYTKRPYGEEGKIFLSRHGNEHAERPVLPRKAKVYEKTIRHTQRRIWLVAGIIALIILLIVILAAVLKMEDFFQKFDPAAIQIPTMLMNIFLLHT